MNGNNKCAVLFIDIKKSFWHGWAFDIDNMWVAELRGVAYKWFKSYVALS